jgi:hypothetical protein
VAGFNFLLWGAAHAPGKRELGEAPPGSAADGWKFRVINCRYPSDGAPKAGKSWRTALRTASFMSNISKKQA